MEYETTYNNVNMIREVINYALVKLTAILSISKLLHLRNIYRIYKNTNKTEQNKNQYCFLFIQHKNMQDWGKPLNRTFDLINCTDFVDL